MKRLTTVMAPMLLSLIAARETFAQPPSTPALPPPAPSAGPPTYSIALQTRHACVTPRSHKLARAEGGFIDVATPSPTTVTATLTGTAAANSYLCCTGTAVESFQLVQDLDISCSDPKVQAVALTLDTALVGFVRSKGRAGACVRRAEVSLTPVSVPGMPMAQAYPSMTVEGTAGQLCNQHLPPLEATAMPVGRYTLVATFLLDTRASGVCDSHAVADFSPDTALPADWVRTRDPFQGVSKKSFGFTATVTAAASSASQPVASLKTTRPVPAGVEVVPTGELADRGVPKPSIR